MVQFTVTNLEDTGAGSLRQAIEDANALAGKDEIIFEDSLSGGEITLASGQLAITDSLTVRGLGADRLTLRGNTETSAINNRIFEISDGFENQDTFFDVELIGLTLTEGSSFGFRGSGNGGAIANNENLTIVDSVLSNNSAADRGGAIENSGILEVRNTAIIDNTSFSGAISLDGGGIANLGTAVVINSTIANNSSVNSGGGIANQGNLEVVNSTITGNTTSTSIIYDSETGEYLPEETERVNSQSGAGISGGATITSSIVAGNSNNADLIGSDTSFISGGNNLIGNGDTVNGFTNGVNGDLVGTSDAAIDPRLSTLQNNGGATPTFALLSDSPAIDAGSNPNDLEFDQRGTGFDRVVNGNADIGAFEVQNTANLVSIAATIPTAIEAGENGIFSISRTGDTSTELIVNLALDDDNTASIDDYSFSGGNVSVTENQITVIIPAGQFSVDLAVTALDDTLAEEAEFVALNIAGSNDYGIDSNNNSATVTIPQNDFDGGTVVTNTNNDGAGSLRQAILNANLFEGTDTITFDPSLAGETITLTSGEIEITDSVNIEGLGAEQIAVSGNDSSRVFFIDDGNSNTLIDVAISELTIQDGLAGDGGGIFNRENLTVNDSIITGNTANSNGGGIYNQTFYNAEQTATVRLNNSTVTGNVSLGTGTAIVNGDRSNLIISQSNITNNSDTNGFNNRGTIYNDGNLEVDNSTISDNLGGGIDNEGTATITSTAITNNSYRGIYGFNGSSEIIDSTITGNTGGGVSGYDLQIIDSVISGNTDASRGGGVEIRSNGRIVNSTISNNSAYNGGGIYNDRYSSLEIINSTISGNSASENGGGIYNSGSYYYEGGTIAIANSTITDNSADYFGSGVVNFGDAFSITSSIIAGNSNDEDIAGDSFTSNGNNLIGNGDDAEGFSDGVNGDIVGTSGNAIDPLLGTLQDNGGNTPTIALLTGSPAIDAGSNPNNLEFDQRGAGFPRTIDGDGDGVAVTDIGAFEADAGTNSNPPNGGENGDEGELIIGTNGKDSLVGGAGDDTLDGGNGKDTLFGGEGNDELFGGRGFDSLVGNKGNDTLRGGNGSDNLNGSAGDDELFGDSGGDFLVGGNGNDFIDGGNGSDTLIGGLGEDSFVIRQQNGADNIIDYIDGTDLLVLTDSLSFEQLDIVLRNNSTEIRLADNNSLLINISSVEGEVIDESDFVAS